jgi:hypothetical protein
MNFKKTLALVTVAALAVPLGAMAATTNTTTPPVITPSALCNTLTNQAANELAQCAANLKGQTTYKNDSDQALEKKCMNYPTISRIYTQRNNACPENIYNLTQQ